MTFRSKMALLVNSNGPDPKKEQSDEPLPNSAVDEFFVKMKHDFRRPKPSEEAVAVALHAIQTLTGAAAVEPGSAKAAAGTNGEECPKCGAANSGLNRFCGYCGALLGRAEKPVTKVEGPQNGSTPGQHFYHHHFHHHYFPDSQGKDSANKVVTWTGGSSAAPQSDAEAALESAIQKLVQEWSVRCNSKRLDDLVELYSSDAIVLRPNVAPAHGSSAIRQLLNTALESGLGEVELDCADIGVVGDIACLTGRSKMLVPVAAGRRHEETGKYLMVARREQGEWKIVADSWCMDSAQIRSAAQNAVVPFVRTPRT